MRRNYQIIFYFWYLISVKEYFHVSSWGLDILEQSLKAPLVDTKSWVLVELKLAIHDLFLSFHKPYNSECSKSHQCLHPTRSCQLHFHSQLTYHLDRYNCIRCPSFVCWFLLQWNVFNLWVKFAWKEKERKFTWHDYEKD